MSVTLLAACGGGSANQNTQPLAVVNGITYVPAMSKVKLDGSQSSDADGDPLIYTWSLASVPNGSGATLSAASAAQCSFTADLSGSYQASLIVNDGAVDSTASTIDVKAVDDAVSKYDNYTYDANGNQTQDIKYADAGTDGIWFTNDDTVNDYYTYSYNSNHNKTKIVHYTGAGADTTWFTADDPIGTYSTNTYDANGNKTQRKYYDNAGVDGVWFTADDNLFDYDTYTNDANGNQTVDINFNGSGTDGTWFQ